MTNKTWRQRCAPIIAKVLRDTKGKNEYAVRQALFTAYPWSKRENNTYKIWLDEIRVQRGYKTMHTRKPMEVSDKQLRMFD